MLCCRDYDSVAMMIMMMMMRRRKRRRWRRRRNGSAKLRSQSFFGYPGFAPAGTGNPQAEGGEEAVEGGYIQLRIKCDI